MAEPRLSTSLAEWLDDLTVRFVVNLPKSEHDSMPRLCFQVEEAQWFYEDFVKPAVAAQGFALPTLHLKSFLMSLFRHSPIFNRFGEVKHLEAYDTFLKYKQRIPVRGGIMLDEKMEKVVLVRGWSKNASWSFPRGKINRDEDDLDCAIREVYEETGYDLQQAGMLPPNRADLKDFEKPIREQHLRFFVFRGVPLDTHLEPRTRKEIGAIKWVDVRDLPGWRKHRGGATTLSANRCYMIAPFVQDLKNWIGQQKRQEAAHARASASGDGLVHAAATDEETDPGFHDTDLEAGQHNDLDNEGLLQMLHADAPAHSSVSDQAVQPDEHMSNLLAMLQGGAPSTNTVGGPKTPFEQMNTSFNPPETPQPQHQRQPPTAGYQEAPPQFHLAPQNIQSSPHSIQPAPTPNIFESRDLGQPVHHQSMAPNLAQAGSQQWQSLHNQQSGASYPQNMTWHLNGRSGPPADEMPFFAQNQQSQQYRNQVQQQPPPALMAQGSQGPLGSGEAPKASQLPIPKLNAHSMKLLDAFKSGAKAGGPAVPTATSARPASSHQTALLDLLKKPSAAAQPVHKETTELPTPSPATEVPQTRPANPERRTTINEITRTLPIKRKQTSTQAVPPLMEAIGAVEKTNSKQLFDPASTRGPTANMSQEEPRKDSDVLPGTVKILQSPHTRQSNAQAGQSLPNLDEQTAKQTQSQPGPPITILARPGSAKDSLAANKLREETPRAPVQPQVLKRPQGSDIAMPPPSAVQDQNSSKRDQLLALFGQPSASPSTAVSPSAAAPEPAPQSTTTPTPASLLTVASPTDERKNQLLGLFNSPRSPVQRPTPTPPPAPRIEPERRPPSAQQLPKAQSTNQNLLLDLFHRPSLAPSSGPATGTASRTAPENAFPFSSSADPITSPGTPISPFALGTPVTATTRQSQQDSSSRSRLGSVASASASSSGGGGGGAETPREAKEFLMGFLNGVVQKEGGRGGARR